MTNNDKNIPPEQRCNANYRATGRDDTIRIINTSINDDPNVFNFVDGTGIQQALPNQLFVSFTEGGSCENYDQYTNDRDSCVSWTRPPVSPDDYVENYRGNVIITERLTRKSMLTF